MCVENGNWLDKGKGDKSDILRNGENTDSSDDDDCTDSDTDDDNGEYDKKEYSYGEIGNCEATF